MNETELDLKQKFEQEIAVFATKYSVTKLKLSTLNFDREYRRNSDGEFVLISEKAIIRCYGKITKVPIGENQEFSTFEEAEEATKNFWSEYYRKTRAARTEDEKNAEAIRQRKYREKYKEQGINLKRQQ